MSEKESAGKESSEIRLSEIDTSLAILKGFETDRSNPEVLRAREVMREVFTPYIDWFNFNKVAITYHGSLQYHDPINLDPDIFFISHQRLPREDFLLIDDVFEEAFARPGIWPRKPSHPDLGYESINDIEKAVTAHGDRYDYDEDEDETNIVGHASYVLSSALLFEEQRLLFEQYQKEVRHLAQISPWLQNGISQVLQSAIAIRQERRQ